MFFYGLKQFIRVFRKKPSGLFTNPYNIKILTGILFLTFFLKLLLPAQPIKDSLLHILNAESLNEEEQSVLYSKIADEFLNINLDSARYFATKGLKIAEQSEHIDGALKNTIILGDVALRKDSLIDASHIYLKATELAENASDRNSILLAWIALGNTHNFLSDYDRSLEYYYMGLHIADSLMATSFQAKFYNNIAIIYDKMGNERKSLGYFFKAATILKEIGDEYHYANTLLNLGGAFLDLNSIDSALFYLNKSRDINERINNHYGLLNYYANIFKMEFRAGSYEKALVSCKHQFEEIEKLDDSFFGSRSYLKAGAYLHFGDVYLKLGEYKKAIENYKRLDRLATKSSFLTYRANANEGLSDVYETLGNSDSALVYLKLFQIYNDSLKKEDTFMRITELEQDYEFHNERKRLQNEKEKIESAHKVKALIYLSIAGASFTGLLLLFLLFIRQKNKHKQSLLIEQNLQLEKENLSKDLEFKNKELAINVMYLLKKNEFISEMSNKLKGVDCNADAIQPKVILDIIKELDKNTSNEVWEEFEMRLQEIYGDFYKRLNDKFPGLTPNELKLSAFLKLNMTTKEISAITFQSAETLKKARYRLRKKLGLSRDDNLVAFLNRV